MADDDQVKGDTLDRLAPEAPHTFTGTGEWPTIETAKGEGVYLSEGGEFRFRPGDAAPTPEDKVIRDMGAARVVQNLLTDRGVGWAEGHFEDITVTDTGSGYLPDPEVADFGDLHSSYERFNLEAPVQALDMHLSQWSHVGTGGHRHNTEAFLRSYYAARAGISDEVLNIFIQDEREWLYDATTIYIEPDVADVVEQMGQAMPPDILRETDVPLHSGFLVFGKTWEYLNFHVDGYVGKLPIRAISWKISDHVGQMDNTLARGVYVMLYIDWSWVASLEGFAPFPWASPPLFVTDLWAWSFDTWWQDRDPGEEPDQHHASMHVGEMRRKLLALWRFMNDEIVRTRRTRMPRPALRRWGRSKKKVPEDGSIVTIHLRRYQYKNRLDHDEHAVIEWSHRWWVRGHYRYNPKTDQKDIWVRPYLKGPDGLPIVVKEKLISVDR